MDILNFYEEDNEGLNDKIGEIRELQKIEEERLEEDVAIEIQGGKRVYSHEAQKKDVY